MPLQSRMPEHAAAEAALGELAARAASLHAASGGNLLACFARVPDPRDPRGVRHCLASILAMCTAAAVCGCTSLEDVTAWVLAADPQVLAVLGCPRNGLGICVPPHPDTIVLVFTLISAQQLADHAGEFLARRAAAGPHPRQRAGLAAARNGRQGLRGAAGPDGLIPYLLAAATHDTTAVIAERLIGPKTNEVPEFAPLLRELNARVPLAGHVNTIDAGHTVRSHAVSQMPRQSLSGELGRASIPSSQRQRHRHVAPRPVCPSADTPAPHSLVLALLPISGGMSQKATSSFLCILI